MIDDDVVAACGWWRSGMVAERSRGQWMMNGMITVAMIEWIVTCTNCLDEADLP